MALVLAKKLKRSPSSVIMGPEPAPPAIKLTRSASSSTLGTVSTAETTRSCSEPLENPFPSPAFHQVSIPKPNNCRVGVSFQGKGGTVVKVENVAEDSPFRNTAVATGQQVVAINGKTVPSMSKAMSLIMDTSSDEASKRKDMTLTTVDEVSKPCCKTVAASVSMQSPGLNFESVRNNSLVRVSLIYQDSPFANSSLREGDIVFTINGIPVQTADEANRVLRHQATNFWDTSPQHQQRSSLKGCEEGIGFSVILYVLDFEQYQQHINELTMERLRDLGREVVTPEPAQRTLTIRRASPHWANVSVSLAKSDSSSCGVLQGSTDLVVTSTTPAKRAGALKGIAAVAGGACAVRKYPGFVIDPNNLHLKDPQSYLHMVPQNDWGAQGAMDWHNPKLFFKGKYASIVHPFLRAYNQEVDRSLTLLQEAVGKACWEHAVTKKQYDMPRSTASFSWNQQFTLVWTRSASFNP